MIRTTIVTVSLIVATGVAHAQLQAPSTPEGRDGRSIPGATSNPNTGLPKSPMNPSAAEAAAKAELEKKGYTGVKSLNRDPAGNWAGKAMKNNMEMPSSLSQTATSGNSRPIGLSRRSPLLVWRDRLLASRQRRPLVSYAPVEGLRRVGLSVAVGHRVMLM